MTYRTAEQIFPTDYEFALSEEDAKRQCSRILAEALEYQNIQHICREISRTVDPYNREYLVSIMHEMILSKSMSDDYDSFRLSTYQMEQLESEERFVIRKARSDQWNDQTEEATRAIEQQHGPDVDVARTYMDMASENFGFLSQQMRDLSKRVAVLEDQSKNVPTEEFLWPTYTDKASIEDRRHFENTLRVICTSGKKKMSSDARRFICSQSMRGLIIRPGNIAVEHSYLLKFGYPFKKKAYYGANES